jgi:hypothetical protein
VFFCGGVLGRSSSAIKSSELRLDFKEHFHWGPFALRAKSAWKRARSLALRGRRTPPFLMCEMQKKVTTSEECVSSLNDHGLGTGLGKTIKNVRKY